MDLVGEFDEIQAYVRALPGGVTEARPFQGGKKYMARDRLGVVHEFEIAWEGTTGASLIELVEGDPGTIRIPTGQLVPSLDLLYALKMSHRYLKDSPHFLKTMRDIHRMRAAGCRIRDEHREWYSARVRETYWYRHPSLKVMKGDFFKGDGVRYVYDHDDIHVAVAHWGRNDARPAARATPAYTLYMREGAEVDCDRERFEALPTQIRLWGVLEEAQVLALERSQIPFRGQVTPRWSFDKALMKVCTSITSGWFREFAWEHYDRVQEMYEENYADRFWAAVEAGLVRKLPEENDGQMSAM